MSSYYYYRTKKTNTTTNINTNTNNKTKTCIITIEPTLEVETQIYKVLAQQKNISLDTIREIYTLSDIKPACEGCVYEFLGQHDHMRCPYGCLHNRDICYWCNILLVQKDY